METKNILERYAKYYEYLQKLGSYPLGENVTIEELGLTKGAIQNAYKEIKKTDFEGNLIDYLCLVSMEYMIMQMRTMTKGNLSFKETCAYLVEQLYHNDPSNINNILRLTMKNPRYLYNLAGEKKTDDKTVKENLPGYEKLFDLWLAKYLTNKTK